VVRDDAATVEGEAELVERARAGDMDAFEQLVGPLIEPAARLACVILRDWHEAEDAVQEAAFKAWRAVSRLRAGTTALRPWFFTIVANEARSRRRSRWWGVVRMAEPRVGVAAGPEERVALSADLQRAMDRLNETERLILFLHFYLDLPVEEVGRVLGLTYEATRSRMYRATRSLRPALQDGEDH
jgi:RNA polymerase sigma-70 factor (ECF subfamily)